MLFFEQRKHRLKRYQTDMLSYATALARDSDLAQDLCQDCAVKVLRAKNAPKDERIYKAWMLKILRNLWLDHLRRTGRRNETPIDGFVDEASNCMETESRIVNSITVRMAFEELSDDHRDVLALVDLNGFSYLEASEFLGITTGTVMSRVSRARSRMLSLLERSNVIDLQTKKKQADR